MLGLCLEIKTTCKFCSSPLMLNALSEDISCSSCYKINKFSVTRWFNLLEDAIKEIPRNQEGEGSNSTIMSGDYNFAMMYGRLTPRCGTCKEELDDKKLEQYSNEGKFTCKSCNKELLVRKLPDNWKNSFTNISYVVGEDMDLLRGSDSQTLPNATKPVIFNCPSCAGGLKVDGKERMVDCTYCNSSVYLPDDLWLRLHPVKEIQRWFMVLDETFLANALPEWDGFEDCTCDANGNVYICSQDPENDSCWIWSFGPDRQLRWKRNDFKFQHNDTHLVVAHDGNLYVWNKNKNYLLKLSSQDGTTLQKMEGKFPSKEDKYPFLIQHCDTMAVAKDGTMLAFIKNEIVRYAPEGKRIQLWTGKKFGLIGSGLGNMIVEKPEYGPDLKEISSYPKRIDSDYTNLNRGWDGFIYAIDRSSDARIIKFDDSGKILLNIQLPLCRSQDGKVWADKQGNIFVLGRREKDGSHLVRISPDGKNAEVVLKNLEEDGPIYEELDFCMAPDGTLYVFDTYNEMKVFSPDFKLLYRSADSEERDTSKLEDLAKSKD